MEAEKIDDILNKIWNDKAKKEYFSKGIKDLWYWNVPKKIVKGEYNGKN